MRFRQLESEEVPRRLKSLRGLVFQGGLAFFREKYSSFTLGRHYGMVVILFSFETQTP